MTRFRTACEHVLRHACGLRPDHVPPAAMRAAAVFLHDSLAVGIAGSRAPHADQILAAAAGWGRTEHGSSLLGRPGIRLPAPQAAFVNAFQIHNQEFDCEHEAAVVHPLAALVAALLAEAERSGPYSGQRFLTALVAGVDVACCLGLAATTPLRFFRPATAGVFGSIAGLVALTGAPLQVARVSFGYGMAFASGTMQPHLEGKPALPVQNAAAASSAIRAFDLARAGLPGPVDWPEGPFGYLPLFESGHDVGPLDTLGKVFRITEVSWKPFPTGRAAHGAIVAVQTMMREQGLDATRLDRLTYSAPPLIARLVGRPYRPGMQPAYARLCAPYLMAVTLLRGTVALDDFDERKLADAAVAVLAARCSVQPNDNPDPAAFVPAQAVAVLNDGMTLQHDVVAQLGSPAFPLTAEQHDGKARTCLAHAGFDALHVPLASLCEQLRQLSDVSSALRAVLEPA